MTVVYLIRHSEPFRKLLGKYSALEEEQLRNEKNPLSVNGEKKAEAFSNCPELQNIDILYSSNYVRAMCTAKYICEKNNILLNVDERLGERKFGVNSMSELPPDFYEKQFSDFGYKIPSGESINEVSERMQNVITEIITNNKDKKIAIVSHGTAINAYLKNYCQTKMNEHQNVEIYFNEKLIFDGAWQCPELFKLEFDDNNHLIDIKNIRTNNE